MSTRTINRACNRTQILWILNAIQHDQKRCFIPACGIDQQLIQRNVVRVRRESDHALVLVRIGLAVHHPSANGFDRHFAVLSTFDNRPDLRPVLNVFLQQDSLQPPAGTKRLKHSASAFNSVSIATRSMLRHPG
jgi:hypothetical protein